MLCSSPIRRGGHEFGCLQCLPCRFNKRRVWTARLLLENQLREPNFFVGLTYADAHLPSDGLVSKRALQLFFKRVRRRGSCRYFAVGEYGGRFGRPHYHALLFGLSEAIPSSSGLGLRHRKACDCVVCASWGLGHVHVGTVTPESCAYVAGYVEKGRLQELARPEFALMSRNPGIGCGAVPVIAAAAVDQVPTALRFGQKILPVGRLLREKVHAARPELERPTAELVTTLREAIQDWRGPAGQDYVRRELVRQKTAQRVRARAQIARSKREVS